MYNTKTLFEERKKEIDLYCSLLFSIEMATIQEVTHLIPIIQQEKNDLIKIMKSNLILMLYNLIEACIITGFTEIYDKISNSSCSYSTSKNEIQKYWLRNYAKGFHKKNSKNIEEDLRDIIDTCLNDNSLIFYVNDLNSGGNLNAAKIRKLCDEHCIRYTLKTDGERLSFVHLERNKLAHGNVSFTECSKDLSSNDLELIKKDVFVFIHNILQGMSEYYEGEKYLRQNNTI